MELESGDWSKKEVEPSELKPKRKRNKGKMEFLKNVRVDLDAKEDILDVLSISVKGELGGEALRSSCIALPPVVIREPPPPPPAKKTPPPAPSKSKGKEKVVEKGKKGRKRKNPFTVKESSSEDEQGGLEKIEALQALGEECSNPKK